MEGAREANENCYNGCFVCLASTWGFVKMMLCCCCRSLARLICPEELVDTCSSMESTVESIDEES